MKGFRFNVRARFLRVALVDDGLQMVPGAPYPVGTVWAARRDISDGERFKAGELASELVARFVVRSTELSRSITPKDLLQQEPGAPLQIVGVKIIRDGALVEITTAERSDK